MFSDLGSKDTGPARPKMASFPKITSGCHKGRSFKSQWYSKWPWTKYSKLGDRLFCFPCRLLMPASVSSSAKDTFIVSGFNLWGNTERLTSHGNSKSHAEAMDAWETYKRKSASRGSVHQQQLSKAQTERSENRGYLTAILDSLLLLAKQGLALRLVRPL